MTGRNPARTEHFPSPTAPTSPTARSGPNTVIGAYEDFLDLARGTDDLSFRLVLELPAPKPHQRADIHPRRTE